MSIAGFLLARIAENEKAARGAMHMGCVEDVSDPPDVMHGLFCPTRILAKCEADRRIVGVHKLVPGDSGDLKTTVVGCDNCGRIPPNDYAYPDIMIAGPCSTLRLLALPYADHPDYREEWKP